MPAQGLCAKRWWQLKRQTLKIFKKLLVGILAYLFLSFSIKDDSDRFFRISLIKVNDTNNCFIEFGNIDSTNQIHLEFHNDTLETQEILIGNIRRFMRRHTFKKIEKHTFYFTYDYYVNKTLFSSSDNLRNSYFDFEEISIDSITKLEFNYTDLGNIESIKLMQKNDFSEFGYIEGIEFDSLGGVSTGIYRDVTRKETHLDSANNNAPIILLIKSFSLKYGNWTTYTDYEGGEKIENYEYKNEFRN